MNFLVVSKEAWGDTRRARKQWLPYFLAQREDVGQLIYLDRHTAWWRGEKPHEPQQFGKIQVIQESLCLPFERFSSGRVFNRHRIAHKILPKLSAESSWVSILYHPFDFAMIKTLKTRSKVAFDWTEDWGVFHEHGETGSLQRKCVEQADMVFTVTRTLYQRAVTWRGCAGGVFHLPNATALEPAPMADEPKVLHGIAHPRIGFVGHAGPWFDEKLVEKLVDARLDWHWVMIGGVSEKVSKVLEHKKNVHRLGVFPPEELKSLMEHCDMLVAPYIKTIQGDATKLYDYLIVKKPIVSTVCETAKSISSWVNMCDGEDDWLDVMDKILQSPHVQSQIDDEDIRQHHWVNRAEQMMQNLQSDTHA